MNASTKPGESSHHSTPSFRLLGCAAASLVALASSASGAVVTTTSLETWTGWVAGPVTQLTFADVGPAPMLFTTQYAEFGVTATQGDDWIVQTSSWDNLGLGGKAPWEPGDPTVDLAFSTPVNAFGVRYLNSVQFDLYSGGSLVGGSGVFMSGVTLGFGGLYSDVAFDSIHIRRPNPSATVHLDDLYLPTIPSPASALILILGASSWRRRCCGGSRGLEG
jgi:hypothetical protein